MHHGPNTVICFIFFFSGLLLYPDQIKSGLTDIKGSFIALVIIFLVAPATAAVLSMTPIPVGIKMGFFLVAVMPTTLSSGVVMTEIAGGNMAHALVITIVANALAVFLIPVTLCFLLNFTGTAVVASIDKIAIMMKIAFLVVVPLCSGLMIKYWAESFVRQFIRKLPIVNQLLVLSMVWMALSQTRAVILNSGKVIGIIFLFVVLFHGVLLAAGSLSVKLFNIGKGRRESVILMGGQKTLPLSIILQASLFPHYGLALMVCVMHHILHLVFDGYLAGILRSYQSDKS